MSWPRAICGALFLLTGCSLVIGELPEPLPADVDAGPNAGAGSGGTNGGSAGSSGGGSSSVPDAGDPLSGGSDAAPNGGTPATGGNDAGFDACDRDGDGEQSEDCGGDDCNDDDRNVFSTQDLFFDHASDESYDYNCDGDIEQKYPEPVSCSIDACDLQTQGFLDAVPPCGDFGVWGKCVSDGPAGLMCQAQMIEMRRVACR